MYVGTTMVGIGLGIAAIGWFMAYGTWMLHSFALKAQAQVTGYHRSQPINSSDTPSEYPILKFTDAQGKEQTVVLSQSSNLPVPGFMLWPGQTVPIIYDPKNPQRVQVDTFIWKWLFPIIIVLVGLGLAIGGAIAIVFSD